MGSRSKNRKRREPGEPRGWRGWITTLGWMVVILMILGVAAVLFFGLPMPSKLPWQRRLGH